MLFLPTSTFMPGNQANATVSHKADRGDDADSGCRSGDCLQGHRDAGTATIARQGLSETATDRTGRTNGPSHYHTTKTEAVTRTTRIKFPERVEGGRSRSSWLLTGCARSGPLQAA
jgi:hypothetical protein